MAFFFALAAKEVVEATAPGGPLHSPRRAAMPLAAAVGGMFGPALIFVALTIVFDRPNLERGWAIPTATDIAFSYLAARLVFGARHPVIPFLLLLAIADDALGLLIIAAFYPTGPVRLIEFAILVGAGMTLAWWLNTRRVRSFWPYVIGAGALSWIGFYRGGLHTALALVPVIPFFPHAARDPGLFVEAPNAHDTLNEFEHRFKRPVDAMLFFFGLANGGVAIGNAGMGTWFVLIAIIAGKPLGIVAATGISSGSRTAPAEGRRLERRHRRRHHREYRVHRGAVLRDGRFPVRAAARRNEARCAAQLRGVFPRARRRARVESGAERVEVGYSGSAPSFFHVFCRGKGRPTGGIRKPWTAFCRSLSI